MRCEPFEDLVKAGLQQVGHPHIQGIRNFEDAGYIKPSGLAIRLDDGHTVYVQFVRASPPGGDTDGWAEKKHLHRPVDGRKMAPAVNPKTGQQPNPNVKVGELERLLKKAIEALDHQEIANIQTYAEAGLTAKPAGLKVTFVDGSEIYAMFVGVAPPGANTFTHPEYRVPKEIV